MSFSPLEIAVLLKTKVKLPPQKRGMDHYKAKLTDAQVQEIRDLRECNGMSYSVLGKKFGVSEYTIRDIVKYRTRVK